MHISKFAAYLLSPIKLKTQVTRLRDTQTYNQANPSVFHIQRSRVQTRQNREDIKLCLSEKEIAT